MPEFKNCLMKTVSGFPISLKGRRQKEICNDMYKTHTEETVPSPN